MKLPQLIKNMPEGDYHGSKDFLSNSQLNHFIRSPAHYQEYLKNPPEQTKAMALGSLIHAAILEPRRLENLAVMPECDRRTKEGKAIYEGFISQNAGKIICTADEYTIAKGCVDSIYAHENASNLLAGADVEASIFFEKNGVKCRSRIDAYNRGALIDVKTTEDALAGVFAMSVARYGYHRQLAFYAMACEAVGLPVERRIIIAVEKSAPFAVSVYELGLNSFWRGQDQVERALADFKACQDSGQWPGYSEDIQTIDLPTYAF